MIRSTRTFLVLGSLALLPWASAQKLDEYSVNSLELRFSGLKAGVAGTKECVSLMSQVLKKAGVTVQHTETVNMNRGSMGMVIGHDKGKLIVSGTCLDGGAKALVSVINPFQQIQAPSQAVLERIKKAVQ